MPQAHPFALVLAAATGGALAGTFAGMLGGFIAGSVIGVLTTVVAAVAFLQMAHDVAQQPRVIGKPRRASDRMDHRRAA